MLHDGVVEGRRTYANIMKYVMMGTSSNFGNMFSMAAAAAFLPFLPMAPVQILLNNMLYDVSEVPIPTDRVDDAEVARPRAWDMKFVRDFMWTIGPVSSLFDFLTFYLLLAWLDAGEKLFQTGWFVESMATQVLVIFVIRTRGRPWASLPSPWLAATSIAIVAVAALLPLTPVGRHVRVRRAAVAVLRARRGADRRLSRGRGGGEATLLPLARSRVSAQPFEFILGRRTSCWNLQP